MYRMMCDIFKDEQGCMEAKNISQAIDAAIAGTCNSGIFSFFVLGLLWRKSNENICERVKKFINTNCVINVL